MPPNKSIAFKCAYYTAIALAAPISLTTIINALEREFYRYQDNTDVKYFPFGGAYSADKELQDKAFLEDLSPIVFEERECLSFTNYDKYLTRLYGDYMQLPPAEKRVAGVHRIDNLDFGNF